MPAMQCTEFINSVLAVTLLTIQSCNLLYDILAVGQFRSLEERSTGSTEGSRPVGSWLRSCSVVTWRLHQRLARWVS